MEQQAWACPQAGVLLFDWDMAGLMAQCWSENAVPGFYTLLKMLTKWALGGPFLAQYMGMLMVPV